ncbi:hypothetical protein DICVIV_01349 [Dictyocaulus viviparus]|uniref:Uncharacterized protein n=1 Tax=Dictyocaulus viviparus TaxID=29172 RepID=A0A0D8Y6L0_DICVI|nr:hypothetical protein DICVIV_01349 [Dictyocaulus viviparus]
MKRKAAGKHSTIGKKCPGEAEETMHKMDQKARNQHRTNQQALFMYVSQRSSGYTVSYVISDGTYKHFPVKRTSESYQFLRTIQVVHDQLFDQVSCDEIASITTKQEEVSHWSIRQRFRPSAS